MDGLDLKSALATSLTPRQSPGVGEYFSVSEADLKPLAQSYDESLRKIMIRCLEQDIWPDRFRAQRGTFTASQQAELLKSTVAVIGAGGLGGTLNLLLSRTGVGHLIVCDGDSFDESNLNRQFLSNRDRLGKNKAECAREEIARITPVTDVSAFPVWVTPENVRNIIEPAQVVIDALDNLAVRYLVEETASDLGIPFIHGALAGLEGMLMTVFPGEPGLKNVYGPIPATKEESAETFLGTPTITPAVVAGFQTNEAVNILLGKKVITRSRLLHFDLADYSTNINQIA